MTAATSILMAIGAFAGSFVGLLVASAKARPAPKFGKIKADFSGMARRLGPGESVLKPGPVTIRVSDSIRVQVSKQGNVIDVVISPLDASTPNRLS